MKVEFRLSSFVEEEQEEFREYEEEFAEAEKWISHYKIIPRIGEHLFDAWKITDINYSFRGDITFELVYERNQ